MAKTPLAERLEEISRDLPTGRLARELNYADRTIRRYLSGERRPERTTVVKWAELAGVDPEYLLEVYETPAPEPPAPRRRRRRRWWLAVPVAVVVVGLAAWLVLRGGGGGDDGARRIALVVFNQVTNGP